MNNRIQPNAPYPVPRDDTSGYGGDQQAVMEYEQTEDEE